VFGLARNQRLEAMIAGELAVAKATFAATGKAMRCFKELDYRTRDSWSRARRVVATQGDLCREAPTQPVAQPSRSPASGPIDNYPGEILPH
jgi:hypothetical protein